MSSSRQHGDVPPTYSEILEYCFNAIDDVSTDIVSAGLASNDGSSAYSTDAPKVDEAKAFEEREKCGSGLRLAFRGLCQVGLHIASLRHDREKADELLSRAEEKVDRGAQELLLQQLTSDDNIDSTDQIMSEIASALMAARLSSVQALKDNGQSRAGADVSRLQAVAKEAIRLKADLGDMTARLHIEERVLLQPVLEHWREAVVRYRQHCRGGNTPGARAVVSALNVISSNPTPENVPDKIQEDVKRLLPRLGRRQLQHLLVSIVETLHGGPLAGRTGLVQTFI